MKTYQDWLNFFVYSRFECILIGVIAAIMFFEKSRWIWGVKGFHALAALVLLFIFCFPAVLQQTTFIYIHFAILFGIIIAYAATNKIFLLHNKLLGFLGTISFSLYMVHEIAIVFMFNNPFLFGLIEENLFLAFIIGFTLAVALGFITYKLIEEPFVKLKNRLGAASKKKTEKQEDQPTETPVDVIIPR